MKKRVLTLFAVATVSFAALTTVSCSDDDSNNNNAPIPSSFVLDRNNLKGNINDGEVVLESGTYMLTGKLVVKAGAKLIIKPGVKIIATNVSGGDIRYIAISQDAEIYVQGTATNPVVMTAETQEPGKWGGLVICGRAPINKGLTAQAEVGDNLTYGGIESDDSSGSIEFLRVEYPGYAYNNEKEFNGVSFFGVGNGTKVENVEVYESSDDGFEWFGGTVNSKNLVVINSHAAVGDDLFDWTEGWSGTNENWYGKRTNNGNRGIEADNNANNHMAAPISNPTIKNLTLIGTGDADTSSEHQAMKLRVGTKAMFDNVVLANWKVGFDVQHDEGLGYVAAGSLKATRVKFENVTTKAKGSATTPVTGVTPDVSAIYTEDNTATGAGNGTGMPVWAQGWTVGI